MKKSVDKTFTDYGIRKEGLAILEATCKLNGIDSEWLKESVNKSVKSEFYN